MFKKVFMCAVLCSVVQAAFAELPENILQIIDENRFPPRDFVLDLTVIDKTNVKLVVGASGERSFAIYKAPKSKKGDVVLNLDKNIYFYTSKTSAPVKISPAQKLLGQASIADIISLLYDKNYQIDEFNEDVLTLIATTKTVAYQKIKLRIDKEFYPIETHLYTKNGKLLKTMKFLEMQEFAGKLRPTKLIITNATDNKQTEIIYNTIKLQNIPESHFNNNKIKDLASIYLK